MVVKLFFLIIIDFNNINRFFKGLFLINLLYYNLVENNSWDFRIKVILLK